MDYNKETTIWKQCLIPQLSAFTALPFWYPAIAKCTFTEANFVKPSFNSIYKIYFSKIFNNYKGIETFFVAQLFYPAFDISTSKMSKVFAGNEKPNFLHELSASICTGIWSPIVCNPLKAIMVNLQNNNIKNSYQVSKYIYNESKLNGFYRGSSYFILRNAVYAPCLLILPNHIENHLNSLSLYQNNYFNKLLSFFIPAVIATTVSMPMDVFSTMSLTDLNKKNYKSNFDILKTAYNSRGFKGFFSGYKWRLLATTIEFGIYNIAKKFYTSILE
ncbi:Hypothetical protein KVN_LOCUS403 [uncultured virus]|nr:Hypothetical protein KVN_LOCUS403 [uncultured virus]